MSKTNGIDVFKQKHREFHIVTRLFLIKCFVRRPIYLKKKLYL